MTPRWLASWHPEPREHPMLLCIPPAGAGCGQYRRWQQALGTSVSVVGVQLPGRERRWKEPPPSTVDEAVRAVAAELHALAATRQRLVVFGQSFGGLLGYEIVRRLEESHGRCPTALVVAACRAPHLWVGAGRGLVEDDVELSRLLDLRGLGDDDVDEDTRELMLDLLRSDAQLSLTYADPGGTRVGCSLRAWGGVADEVVSAAHLDGWSNYAAADFHRREFPGNHYFTDSASALVVTELRTLLAPEETPGAITDYGRVTCW